MANELQPLDKNFPIVDEDGRPTIYFIRWAQQRQEDISGAALLDGGNDFTGDQNIDGNLIVTGAMDIPWGSLTGPLSAQTDLQAALNAKLTVAPDALYGGSSVRFDHLYFVAGNNAATGTAYFQSSLGADPAFFGFDSAGFTGGGWMGGRTANNRHELTVYGDITGFEFSDQPYYLTHPLFHDGNLLVFTSVDDGLVPASGGGTAKFLRADQTWAVPPGSGGGTTTHPVTFDVTGGAAAGTTFDGSMARIIDYHTVGAAKTGLITASGLTSSATGKIIARKTAGAGALEEASLSEILDLVGSAAQGDILYRGAAGWVNLGAGTSGYFLKTQGAGANPVWAAGGGGSGAITLPVVDGSVPPNLVYLDDGSLVYAEIP